MEDGNAVGVEGEEKRDERNVDDEARNGHNQTGRFIIFNN